MTTIKVSDFAIGDGVTDDTQGLRNAWAALLTNGGGTLEFSPGKNYLAFPSAIGATLFPCVGTSGVSIAGNGATLTVGRSFVGAEIQKLFVFKNCRDINIDGLNFVSQEQPILETTARGIYPILMYGWVDNVRVTNIKQTGGVAGIYMQRFPSSGETFNTRVRNVVVENYDCTSVGYGIVAASSGDNLFVRNFTTDKSFRSYIAYGIRNHDIQIVSRNHVADDLCLTAYNTPTETMTDAPFLEGIRIDYQGLPATVSRMAGTALAFVAKGPNPVTFRDIEVKLHVRNDATNQEREVIRCYKQLDSVGTPDTTQGRGHLFEGVSVNGFVVGSNYTSDKFILWNDDVSWNGETIRDVSVRIRDTSQQSSLFSYSI